MTKGFTVEEEAAPGTVNSTQACPFESIETETLEIRDRPYHLPVGLFYEGRQFTEFALKPYTGEEELQLSALNKKYQNKVAEVLPRFLADIIDSVSDSQGSMSLHDLAKGNSLSTVRVCENLYLADALTILLQVRLESYGEKIQLAGQCPNCAAHNRDREGEYSMIDTTEVVYTRNLSHPTIEVELDQGSIVFGDTITRIHVRPVRVYDLKRMRKQNSDEQELEIVHEMLMHTCAGIPESEAYGQTRSEGGGVSPGSAEEVFKKLSSGDREAWKEAVGDISSWGPSMNAPMNCRSCGYEFQAIVPWNQLPFFLSRPARKRRK